MTLILNAGNLSNFADYKVSERGNSVKVFWRNDQKSFIGSGHPAVENKKIFKGYDSKYIKVRRKKTTICYYLSDE